MIDKKKQITIFDVKKYKFLSENNSINRQFEIIILNRILNSNEKNTVNIHILDKPYVLKIFDNFYKYTNIKISKKYVK
tara:strand:- start:86 stop:319 length:234 start_codon:yes stop_codon:yes gene_type:complete